MSENSQQELYHYGVLGMKWGIRRANKKGVAYNYRSMGQKKYEKKLEKQKAKGASSKRIAKTSSKLEMYKERDDNRQEYARKANLGKSFAKTLLMGPLGVGNYNRLRSAGSGRVVSYAASNWITGQLMYPITLAVSKSAENRQAKHDIRKKGS